MANQIRTDWKLFAAILLVMTFGLVMVYSASSVVAEVLYKKETWSFAVRQLAAACAGLLLLASIKRIDYKSLKHPIWAFTPLAIVVIMLVGVLVADPQAHRWYRFSGFQFQPSELAKPALVVFLAYFVARRADNTPDATRRASAINDRHTLGPAAIVVAGIIGLVGYGDLGTAAILLVPAIVIFVVAGIERRYFYISMVLALMLAAGAVYQKPYRLFRLLTYVGITEKDIQTNPRLQFLGPLLADSNAHRDADHQPKQAKIAVGSGFILGAGLGNGNQKLGFLPEAHTDFIFGVIGEEVGLVGCLLLLGGYMFIFWRGLRLYWMTPDTFGKYLALGAVTLFTAQALFNMSVVIGLAPTKGIPLPLISYGGSALVCTLITLGLLLSVSERSS
jgi:cell division protein FtsW